jgi:Tfp pilus assembly protein PilN
MRPLNLIPPEDRRGENAPLRAGSLSYVIIGVLAAALIAVVALVMTSNDINENKSEIAGLQARQAVAQQTAQGLGPYSEFATLSENRNATVSELARSRFDWERVLREMALVIPADVTLQNLSATSAGAPDASGATDTTGSAGPSIDISGCTVGQEGVATLLAALRDIDGVTRVGMQSSSLGDAPEGDASAETAICQDPKFATFQITMVFDEAVSTAPVAGTTTATGEVAPAPTTPAATPTTDDGGVAATQDEQADANANAENQSQRARAAAGGDAR